MLWFWDLRFDFSLDLGSSEESGKDWSDLEREAAEADKEQKDFQDEYTKSKKGSGGGSSYRDKYNEHHRKRYADLHFVCAVHFCIVCMEHTWQGNTKLF